MMPPPYSSYEQNSPFADYGDGPKLARPRPRRAVGSNSAPFNPFAHTPTASMDESDYDPLAPPSKMMSPRHREGHYYKGAYNRTANRSDDTTPTNTTMASTTSGSLTHQQSHWGHSGEGRTSANHATARTTTLTGRIMSRMAVAAPVPPAFIAEEEDRDGRNVQYEDEYSESAMDRSDNAVSSSFDGHRRSYRDGSGSSFLDRSDHAVSSSFDGYRKSHRHEGGESAFEHMEPNLRELDRSDIDGQATYGADSAITSTVTPSRTVNQHHRSSWRSGRNLGYVPPEGTTGNVGNFAPEPVNHRRNDTGNVGNFSPEPVNRRQIDAPPLAVPAPRSVAYAAASSGGDFSVPVKSPGDPIPGPAGDGAFIPPTSRHFNPPAVEMSAGWGYSDREDEREEEEEPFDVASAASSVQSGSVASMMALPKPKLSPIRVVTPSSSSLPNRGDIGGSPSRRSEYHRDGPNSTRSGHHSDEDYRDNGAVCCTEIPDEQPDWEDISNGLFQQSPRGNARGYGSDLDRSGLGKVNGRGAGRRSTNPFDDDEFSHIVGPADDSSEVAFARNKGAQRGSSSHQAGAYSDNEVNGDDDDGSWRGAREERSRPANLNDDASTVVSNASWKRAEEEWKRAEAAEIEHHLTASASASARRDGSIQNDGVAGVRGGVCSGGANKKLSSGQQHAGVDDPDHASNNIDENGATSKPATQESSPVKRPTSILRSSPRRGVQSSEASPGQRRLNRKSHPWDTDKQRASAERPQALPRRGVDTDDDSLFRFSDDESLRAGNKAEATRNRRTKGDRKPTLQKVTEVAEGELEEGRISSRGRKTAARRRKGGGKDAATDESDTSLERSYGDGSKGFRRATSLQSRPRKSRSGAMDDGKMSQRSSSTPVQQKRKSRKFPSEAVKENPDEDGRSVAFAEEEHNTVHHFVVDEKSRSSYEDDDDDDESTLRSDAYSMGAYSTDEDTMMTGMTGMSGRSMNSMYTKSMESEVEDVVKDFLFIGSGVANNPGRRRLKYQPQNKRYLKAKGMYDGSEVKNKTSRGRPVDTEDDSIGPDDEETYDDDDGDDDDDTRDSGLEGKDTMLALSQRKTASSIDGSSVHTNEDYDPLSGMWNYVEGGVAAVGTALGLTSADTENEASGPIAQEKGNHGPKPKQDGSKESQGWLDYAEEMLFPVVSQSESNDGPYDEESLDGRSLGSISSERSRGSLEGTHTFSRSHSAETDDGLLQQASCAARSMHHIHGVQYDESIEIDVVKEIKFSVITVALPLGLLFQENGAGVWVARILNSGNAAASARGDGVAVGDQLAAINGKTAIKMTVDDVCSLISNSSRFKDKEIELTFLRYIGPLRPLPDSVEQEGYEVTDLSISKKGSTEKKTNKVKSLMRSKSQSKSAGSTTSESTSKKKAAKKEANASTPKREAAKPKGSPFRLFGRRKKKQ